MFKFYYHLKIDKKLNYLFIITALITSLLFTLLFSFYTYFDRLNEIKKHNTLISKIIIHNLKPLLLENDNKRALYNALSSSKYDENILEIYLIEGKGNILISYTKEKLFKISSITEQIDLKQQQFVDDFKLYTLFTIDNNLKQIGSLLIVYDIKFLVTIVILKTLIVFALLLTSFLVAHRYIENLAQSIIKPLAQLNKNMKSIIEAKTVKFPKSASYTYDEIGTLTESCNQMIERLNRCQEKLLKQKDLLSYKANHDEKTGLPNRALFNDRLEVAIKKADRNSKVIALCFLDIDNFKQINRKYGHDVGDELLKRFAVRLESCLRAEDTVARIGGDEFTILLEENEEQTASITVVNKILSAIKEPIKLGDSEVQLSVSIGISHYPIDAINALDLVRNADFAMYQAQELGKNNFKIFNTN